MPRLVPTDAFPIDWGALAPLRLRARAIVDGVYAGAHRSNRKGSGVEFAGQRPYVPGDDLRFFDRRALLRHDRLMVREFETDTERAVWLCLDATASMAYRSERARGAKLAYAGLTAVAIARVALASGDPVGLRWIGGHNAKPIAPSAGLGAFDRIVGSIEAVFGRGDASADRSAVLQALMPIAQKGRRGSAVVLLSDLVDLPESARQDFLALAARARSLIVVRVLDPLERTLQISGAVRLRSLEGNAVVDTDADAIRATYVARIAGIAASWAAPLAQRGGRFLDATTDDDPTSLTRDIVRALAEART